MEIDRLARPWHGWRQSLDCERMRAPQILAPSHIIQSWKPQYYFYSCASRDSNIRREEGEKEGRSEFIVSQQLLSAETAKPWAQFYWLLSSTALGWLRQHLTMEYGLSRMVFIECVGFLSQHRRPALIIYTDTVSICKLSYEFAPMFSFSIGPFTLWYAVCCLGEELKLGKRLPVNQ